MGRPIRSDRNGIRILGDVTTGSTGTGIHCEAFINNIYASDAYIVKQKGSKAYYVYSDQLVAGTKAWLVATKPANPGEMRLSGWTLAQEGLSHGMPVVNQTYSTYAIPIAKFNKYFALDFNGHKYTWVLSSYDDSSIERIILTQIS
jgi:hypothetical protein